MPAAMESMNPTAAELARRASQPSGLVPTYCGPMATPEECAMRSLSAPLLSEADAGLQEADLPQRTWHQVRQGQRAGRRALK